MANIKIDIWNAMDVCFLPSIFLLFEFYFSVYLYHFIVDPWLWVRFCLSFALSIVLWLFSFRSFNQLPVLFISPLLSHKFGLSVSRALLSLTYTSMSVSVRQSFSQSPAPSASLSLSLSLLIASTVSFCRPFLILFSINYTVDRKLHVTTNLNTLNEHFDPKQIFV